MERGWKPNVEISPNCPRCGSSNTKFCYYNNYSLTQPRYSCKGCRRYWTKGGSLRNVPVGGGCRKNRRGNKSTSRQPIDASGLRPSKHLPSGDVANNPIGHSFDPRKNSSPSSSSAVSDGPNIDLALVYANFLNQKPNSRAGLEKPADPLLQSTVFDPSVEYSSLSNTEVGPSINAFPEELCLSGCLNLSEHSTEPHFGEGDKMYFRGFSSVQKHQDDHRIEQCSSHDTIYFELPPLPGEEAASSLDHMMWSNSDMKINHVLQATQPPPVFGAEAHDDDADLLMGNWSPFDLPRDASFSRP